MDPASLRNYRSPLKTDNAIKPLHLGFKKAKAPIRFRSGAFPKTIKRRNYFFFFLAVFFFATFFFAAFFFVAIAISSVKDIAPKQCLSCLNVTSIFI